ncbi:MAG: WD40/YVTN/BNR-like repeat-containing protein, partial [Thermoanaerobaculia bacterium]
MKKFIGVTLVCVAVPAAVLHAGRGQWRNLGLTAFVVAVAPSDPGVVYAGSADAVWRSEDSGRTWVHTGFRGNEVVSLVVNPADPQSVFVSSVLPGDQGAVLSKTEDGGVTWEAVLAQPFGTFLDLAIPASEPDWMYLRWSDSNFFLKAYVGNILKSENGGLNWADMGPAASIDPRQYWVGSLAVDPENPSLLYIESALGFMKSLDGGVSWTRIGPGPPTGQD